MKITIARSALFKALAHVNSVVEARNNIPILANVHIDAKNGEVRLTATDLDIQIVETVPAHIDAPGQTTISARTLFDIVRKIPDGAQIELFEQNGKVSIVAGRARFSLATLPYGDFPIMSSEDMPHQFHIDAALLGASIAKARFAISTEETRYYLNGIFMQIENNKLQVVATDGHRLALVTLDPPGDMGKIPDIIIPRKCIGEIVKLLDDIDGNLEISLSERKVQFVLGDVTIMSKLIDGTFPDYRRVIPTDNTNSVITARGPLIEAIDRVTAIASEKTRSVKFSVGNGAITLSVVSPENGTATDEVPATNDESVQIGFNSRYLLDALAQVATDMVEFKLSSGTAPAIIKGVNIDDYTCVLMPMRT